MSEIIIRLIVDHCHLDEQSARIRFAKENGIRMRQRDGQDDIVVVTSPFPQGFKVKCKRGYKPYEVSFPSRMKLPLFNAQGILKENDDIVWPAVIPVCRPGFIFFFT